MHDIRVLREQMDALRDAVRRRGAASQYGPALDQAAAFEGERRTLIQAVEERKAARNATSQEVARLKRNGEPADDLIIHGRGLGEEIARLEDELTEVETVLQRILLDVPNFTLPDVPEGDEANNVVVREWGTPRPPEGVRDEQP